MGRFWLIRRGLSTFGIAAVGDAIAMASVIMRSERRTRQHPRIVRGTLRVGGLLFEHGDAFRLRIGRGILCEQVQRGKGQKKKENCNPRDQASFYQNPSISAGQI